MVTVGNVPIAVNDYTQANFKKLKNTVKRSVIASRIYVKILSSHTRQNFFLCFYIDSGRMTIINKSCTPRQSHNYVAEPKLDSTLSKQTKEIIVNTINRCRDLISELVQTLRTADTLVVKSVRVGFVAQRNNAIDTTKDNRGLNVVLDASVIHPDENVRAEQLQLKELQGKDYEWMDSLKFLGRDSYGGNSNHVRASLKLGMSLARICDWDEFLDADDFAKTDFVKDGSRITLSESRIAGKDGLAVLDKVFQGLGISSHSIGKKTKAINEFLQSESFMASKLDELLHAETEKDEGKDKDKDDDKIIVKVELAGDDYIGDIEKVCRQVGKHYELTTQAKIKQWGIDNKINAHDCPVSFRALADGVKAVQALQPEAEAEAEAAAV